MKYSIWQNIKYRSNLSRAVVHLQADLNHLPPLPQLSVEISVREVSIDSDDDLEDWVTVVNDAYRDSTFTVSTARECLKKHLFLNVRHVFVFFVGGEPVGTSTVGVYKGNSEVGGDTRVAVRKEHQGKGLGRFILIYAFGVLRAGGIRYAESVVTIHRTASLFLHFKCGWIPQYESKCFAFKGQRRYWFIRYYLRRRLMKRYRDYQTQLTGNSLGGE